MIAFFAVFVQHVPKYGGCDHNCCHFPHGVTTSQVAYLKGSGGIQYDIHDLEGEAHVDFDVVFKEPYDTSTFSVFAGCGGCHSERPFHWEEPSSLPIDLPETYYNPKLEAFTQHSYYELLTRIPDDGTDRSPRFNTSGLSNCSDKHFSVRVVLRDNATQGMVYGVVVGCQGLECERFTALEMLSFPIYVMRTHGPAWNDASWTLVLIALTVPWVMWLVLWYWHGGWLAFHIPVSVSFPRQLAAMQFPEKHWANLRGVCWEWSPRCVVYAIATYAIVVDLLETFAHFLIAAQDVPTGDSGYFVFTMWYGLKVSLLLAVALPWLWAREVPETLWRAARWECACGWFQGLGPFSPIWGQGFWSLIDMAVAVAALFVGAGFYLFPVAAFVAGSMRLVEWMRGARAPGPPCDSKDFMEKTVRFKLVEDTACALLPALAL